MTLSERAKKRREELGMNLTEVAKKMGVSTSTVMRYETQDTEKITAVYLEKLAEALNVTPGYLMGWEEKDELQDYLDMLHKRPEMKTLFSISKNATKKDVEQAIKIIEALKGSD
jgi:transcriptional regulator with XRE-family HTH domain